MFTLDQLRGFVAVAEELHFGRAAERLRMTQPPLSRQIQKLERSVGVQLLDRDNRTVELTTAGAAFLVEARRLLGLADGALDHVRRIHAGSAGTVRIGFTATAAFGVLPSLLNRVGAAYPEIDLELQELVTRDQLDGLLSGDLDLGLARPPFDTPTFASRLLHREALLLAVPAPTGWPGVAGPVNPGDLANELVDHARADQGPLLLRPGRPADPGRRHRRRPLGRPGADHALPGGRRPRDRLRAGVRRPARDRGLAYRPIAGLPPAPVELHLLWLREATNPALRMLLDAV